MASLELPYLIKPGKDVDGLAKDVAHNFEAVVGALQAQAKHITRLEKILEDGGIDLEQLAASKQGNEDENGNQTGDDQGVWGIGVDSGILAVVKTSTVATTFPDPADPYDIYAAYDGVGTYTFATDRPMRVFMVSYAVISNSSGAGHPLDFILRVIDPDAVSSNGDSSQQYIPVTGITQLMNIRTYTAFTEGEYQVQWGFKSADSAFSGVVHDRKLLVFLSAAPNAEAVDDPGTPNWTVDAQTIASYQRGT